MAFSNILLPIKAVFDDKGLKEAQSQFGKLGKGLKTALGLAGVTVGIAALTSVLREAAKAASDDAKSQILLAQQLRNTANASQGQIDAVEQSIAQMSIMAAVADDQLRPAMASLVRATGDVAKAQDLLGVSLDVSAATGKDLQSVSLAIGKAVSGQTQQLFRMIPALKGSDDWMGKLREQTKGMAEVAGDADPYMRLNIIFDEMQEQIGSYLLPIIQKFSDYLATAEFGDAFDKFAFSVGKAIQQIDILFTQLTGENALTWLLNTVSEIIYQVLRLIKSFTILGDILGKQGQAWLKLDFNTLINFDWQKYAADQIAAFDKSWKQESTKLKAKPFVPFGTGSYTGGGGSNGLTDAQKRAAELAKKNAEAYKKILETEAKIREEAVAAAQEAANATLAMRDSFTALLAGVAPLKSAGQEISDFEQQVVDSFMAIEEAITSAVADGTLLKDAADALRKYAADEQKVLADIARQRAILTKKIDIAKSISAGVLASGNIVNLNSAANEQAANAARAAEDAAQKVKQAVDLMQTSFDQLLTGVAPLKRAGNDVGEFESQVVASFNNIFDAINKSVADGTLLKKASTELQSYAASELQTLQGIARQRDALAKKIDLAKAISSGVLNAANITGLMQEQTRTVTESFTMMVNGIRVVASKSFEEITKGSLVDNFKKVIDKTKTYAKNLIELKRLGLNGQLFKQIVDAGVDGGSDAAAAVAAGGQATVNELNSLFSELNSLGSDIASTSTDVMYSAGQDVMNSFIQSLQDQDAALEAAAISLADKFAESFSSRLKDLTVAVPAIPDGKDAATGLIDQFKNIVTKTKDFAKNLDILKKMGLNETLFKQIVDAGVDGGATTASAIVAAGQTAVDELNNLFAVLNELGASIASTSTDLMFQAGQDTMNSYIQGLIDKEKELQDTADVLAKKFADQFNATVKSLTPLAPMPSSNPSLTDAMNGYVADTLGRTFTGPYNYYSQTPLTGSTNVTVNVNAGAVANKAELPSMIVDAIGTYVKTSGAGALKNKMGIA